MEGREKLGSRLSFILLSAGCAIGCGNVWKFPWMCGENGGAAFVLVYLICLAVLGLPVMTAELSLGRASQKSPLNMYRPLEPAGTKWHLSGGFAFAGNLLLMMFYTTVSGWMMYYFVQFLTGSYTSFISAETGKIGEAMFGAMLSDPQVNVGYMGIVVVLGFGILAFGLKGGLERVTKSMMSLLFILMGVLAVRSCTLPGSAKGLEFYLKPDFSKINGKVVVSAMNQAFFTLSLGIGSMAIFGSYIDKERSLGGESVNIIVLDTVAALLAGFIIFPACSAYNTDVGAGPGLLFETMATVFQEMQGGRIWGTLFFLFMVFASMSTVLAVFENILAMFREMTGLSRPISCLICAAAMFLLSVPCALGYNLWSNFHPFSSGTVFLDLWDFCVNYCLLPIGSLMYILFCCYGNGKKFGWGWDNFMTEVNTGKGLKISTCLKPLYRFVVPVIIIVVFIYGMATYSWRDKPAAEAPASPAEAASVITEDTAEALPAEIPAE